MSALITGEHIGSPLQTHGYLGATPMFITRLNFERPLRGLLSYMLLLNLDFT